MSTHGFCCAAFADQLSSAGQRGFAIIPVKDFQKSNQYVFFIQSRSEDLHNETSKHTIIDQVISFCPWCGTKLSEVAKNNEIEIASLAKKNGYLVRI